MLSNKPDCVTHMMYLVDRYTFYSYYANDNMKYEDKNQQ